MPEGATQPAPPAVGRADTDSGSGSGFLGFLPIETAPPLAGLAALSAFAAMILNQVMLPGLGNSSNAVMLAKLTRAGQFAANLAVISGLGVLVICAWSVARGTPALAIGRRITWVLLSLVILRAGVIATLFERVETTRENVHLAVAAANLLGVLAGVIAFEQTRGSMLRVLALLATALPVFSIGSVLLELTADLQLDPWKQYGHKWAQGLGELSYVGLLLLSFPLLIPRGLRLRDLIARSFGLAVLVASVYALRTAEAALHNEFPVLFYHAQRVGLLLDRYPLAYAVPFCLALSAVTTGLLASSGARWQAAAAILLLLASGYAPRAPGRLLSMALGFLLLSRALIALASASRESRSST